ncbi:MAG: hypothetical protein P8J86_00515 [Phycisphaerales bacterium]|jgi:uncharacterized coiled-coil protein SlyX|nr:hypothetical protein [Phycisphaerales bacterium]
MNRAKQVGFVAGAAALTLSGLVIADTDAEAKNRELEARLAAAETKINQLSTTNNDQWLTDQRADEIRGLVQDVLADADTRASLLQGGVTSGYQDGFMIVSADNNWSLKINGLMQTRWVWNQRADNGNNKNNNDDNFGNNAGFELARMALNFSGNVVDPSWTYNVRLQFGTYGGYGGYSTYEGDSGGYGGNIDWAYIDKDLGGGLSVRMGIQKTPLMREWQVNAENQLGIERSLVSYYFQDGVQNGLSLAWESDMFRIRAMYGNGDGQGSVQYDNYANSQPAFTARAEFLAGGTWDQFESFTSMPGDEAGILIGVAGSYENTKKRYDDDFKSSNSRKAQWRVTGDAQVDFGGATLAGSLTWSEQRVKDNNDDKANPWGAVVQAGVFVTDDWEVYGRFQFLDYDEDMYDDMYILAVGLNGYLGGTNNIKWSTEVGYSFGKLSSLAAAETSGANNGAGYTNWYYDEKDKNKTGEWMVRTQLQLYF